MALFAAPEGLFFREIYLNYSTEMMKFAMHILDIK